MIIELALLYVVEFEQLGKCKHYSMYMVGCLNEGMLQEFHVTERSQHDYRTSIVI